MNAVDGQEREVRETRAGEGRNQAGGFIYAARGGPSALPVQLRYCGQCHPQRLPWLPPFGKDQEMAAD